MNKKITIAVFFISIFLVGVIILVLNAMDSKQEKIVESVGLVIPGSKDEVGWNGFQYRGVKFAVNELGVKLNLAENAAEGQGLLAHASDSLIALGTKMIVLASFNYPSELQEYMKVHPDVTFYGISNDLRLDNFVAYSVRAYQARFLSGVIAALHSENGKLGYIAAMKNPEVIRGINAFALGARRINPKAKIIVAWTNSWDDEQVERSNVEKLVKNNDVDVVAYQQNRTFVLDAADSLGVKSIAYGLDHSEYSEKVLASTASNWGKAYQEFIRDYLQKKRGVNNYWVGIEKDAVGVSFYSSAVSDSARKVVEGMMESMKEGMDVFMGPIYDNHHKKRCEKDELISDKILRDEMDWLVEGVFEYED